MAKKKSSSIIKEYEAICPLYEEFILSTKNLIEGLIAEYKLKCLPIQRRLKDIDSLRKKIERKRHKYKSIHDITDICGIRIITYFSDEVDKVSSMIQKEFAIDEKNSVDKRALLQPDRFGYLSLQFVAKLSNSRLALTEYHRFKECQIEIQIQSLLQHAWAEIEHDLGYKSGIAVPKDIQRRFNQLSGLLELTDEEFIRLRDTLFEYKTSLADKINKTPDTTFLDQDSLLTFIETSEILREIESRIESENNIKLSFYSNEHKDFSEELERLAYCNYSTIEDIDIGLNKFKDVILNIARNLIHPYESHEEVEEGGYSPGLSIFYLPYAYIGSKGSVEDAVKFIDTFGIGDDEEDTLWFANQLISWYKQATE